MSGFPTSHVRKFDRKCSACTLFSISIREKITYENKWIKLMKLIRYMPLLRTSCKLLTCVLCVHEIFSYKNFYNPQANYTTWIPYFTCSEKGTTCILHNATCVTYYKWALIWEEKFAKFFVRMKGTTADALYSHCGNFIIFLLLRFYVKSILGILEVQNHLEAWNFDICEFLHFCILSRLKFVKLTKFWNPKIA